LEYARATAASVDQVFILTGSRMTVNFLAFKRLYIGLTEIACVGIELLGRFCKESPLDTYNVLIFAAVTASDVLFCRTI